MNLKSCIIVCGFLVFSLQNTMAQSNLLNAKTPDKIGVQTDAQKAVDLKEPLEYGYIDDRDILWSKVTWEYIDLNERLNLSYYYPIDSTNAPSNRRSLFDTLLRGIKQGKITEVYNDSYFTKKMSFKEIQDKSIRIDTTDYAIDLINQGETDLSEAIDEYPVTSQDVKGFKIKGLWFFDKKQGELKYRLLGIAPVTPDVNTLGREDIDVDLNEQLAMFWVWYPNARQELHQMKVFNPKNSAYPISFDHMLNARRFTAILYKEENVYGDREVKDYIRGNALFQVMESDRIRDGIRNKEHDMWNY